MGTLHYGASRTSIRVDDHVLAHLQAVITAKQRRSEGMLLQWERSSELGSGRGAFWIHAYCDLSYEYDGGKRPALDSAELDRLMQEASGNQGLRVRVSTHGQPSRL